MKGMLPITLVLSLVPLGGETSDTEIRTVAGAVLLHNAVSTAQGNRRRAP